MMRIVFDTNITIQHFRAAWGRTRVITARRLVELVTPKPLTRRIYLRTRA